MAELDPRVGKAFDLGSETVKQLLALATAVLGVTATFAKEIVAASTPWAKYWLTGGWVMLILSLCFGVGALMNMSGQLGRIKDISEPDIYARGIAICVGVQTAVFVSGLGLVVVSAWISLP
jgi:hypothetical protein